LTLGSLAFGSAPGASASDSGDGISHSAESIHQEPSFNAGRMRVYEALTMTEQFDQIIKLTDVMHSPAMAAMRKPTQISRHAGGTFTLFGGYIPEWSGGAFGIGLARELLGVAREIP